MCQPTTAPSGKKTTSSKLSSTSVKPTSMRPTVPATKPNASLAVDGNVNKIPLTNLRHFSDYTITVSINVWGYVCAMTARCAAELLKPILKLVGFWGEYFWVHSLWNDRVHQLVATGGFPGFILVCHRRVSRFYPCVATRRSAGNPAAIHQIFSKVAVACLYTWAKRHTVKVNCRVQEHN